MKTNDTIFSIPLFLEKKEEILARVNDYLIHPTNEYFHIVSLNPEIIVQSKHDALFRQILIDSSLKILDGVGVVVATHILNLHGGVRYSGVDLLKDILTEAGSKRFRTVLIGGKPKLADSLADCYNHKFGVKTFYGIEVSQNISGTNIAENSELISRITALKPRILFLALGSPKQEKWIYEHRDSLKGVLCMGVGGGFDFLTGQVRRAPHIIRRAGLEWLFRLMVQPWRIKRQLRLLEFVLMVLKERFKNHSPYDRS